MSWTVETLLADAVGTAAAVSGMTVFTMGLPDKAQAFGPWGFLEYGGAEIEQASDEVITHTLLFHCLMPTRGNLPALGEYATVLQTARLVHRAFYANVMIGNDEAATASYASISKPDIWIYGGVQNVRATLTMQCVTSEDVSALLSV